MGCDDYGDTATGTGAPGYMTDDCKGFGVAEPLPQPPTTVDDELSAMTQIVDAIGSLDDGARERVMRWTNDRFYRVSSVLNEG